MPVDIGVKVEDVFKIIVLDVVRGDKGGNGSLVVFSIDGKAEANEGADFVGEIVWGKKTANSNVFGGSLAGGNEGDNWLTKKIKAGTKKDSKNYKEKVFL